MVGSFILNKVTSIINKSDIDLCHDDGLEIFQNVSKPEMKNKKKVIVKVLKGVVCQSLQCNLKIVDLLDVTFNLDSNVYKPFRKENNNPFYINKDLTIHQAFSNNYQSQLKNEYTKLHLIRIFLMNQ